MKKTIIIVILVLVAGLTIGGIALVRNGQPDEPPVIEAGSIADRLNRAAAAASTPGDDIGEGADVEWWRPITDDHRRMCGIWYGDDTVLHLYDDATVTVFSGLRTVDDCLYYTDLACGFWWSDAAAEHIFLAPSLQMHYDDGVVTQLELSELSDSTLTLTLGGDSLTLSRVEMPPMALEGVELPQNAVFDFTFSPRSISAADIARDVLKIETKTYVLSGRCSWWGSSTDHGAAVTLRAADGSTLEPELMDYTDDYTLMTRRAGDIIRGVYRFAPAAQKDGRIAPGVYDVILCYGGQTQVFEGGLVIEP